MSEASTAQAPKVYIETSVWGMTLPSQPRRLREATKRFLSQCRAGLFVPYISTVVLDEIKRAGRVDAIRLQAEINRLIPFVLEPDEEIEQLARAYIRAKVDAPDKSPRRPISRGVSRYFPRRQFRIPDFCRKRQGCLPEET